MIKPIANSSHAPAMSSNTIPESSLCPSLTVVSVSGMEGRGGFSDIALFFLQLNDEVIYGIPWKGILSLGGATRRMCLSHGVACTRDVMTSQCALVLRTVPYSMHA